MIVGCPKEKNWIVILVSVLLSLPAYGARWGQVDLSIGDNIHDVFFLDQDRGFLVGANGLIRYTLNGGEAPGDWLAPNSSPTFENLYKVFFVDSLNGFAVGGNGTLLTTSNGGVDWDDSNSLPTAQNLTSVFFEDQSIGWVTSFELGQPLWETSSGAVNLQLRFGLDGQGRDVLLYQNDGWLVVNDTIFPGLVYESSDHGQNWFQTGPISGSTAYYAVTRNGLGEVWVVGQNGTMIRGPSPWQTLTQPVGVSLRDIAFSAASPQYGWAVGDSGTLLGTDDAGDTWVEASVVAAQDLHAVAVSQHDRAWAVGDSGTYLIYRECIDDTDCIGTILGCVDFSVCDQTQHVCGVVLPDTTLCDDGLYCTVADACQLGACVGVAKDCSVFSDQCNQGLCDEDLDSCYAQPINEGLGCDDGLFCKVNETCVDGSCSGQSKDCSGLSDQCNQGVCDDDLDSCYAQPINEGQACDDGWYCTVDDTCQGGSCNAQARDCTSFSDQCNQGLCDDDQDTCYAQPTNEGLACNDGDQCTMQDACMSGLCQGVGLDQDADGFVADTCGGDDCDDSRAEVNPAVFESAFGQAACLDGLDNDCDALIDQSDPGCAQCEVDQDCLDQNVCNGLEKCVDALCILSEALQCDDQNECTQDECDPQLGCFYTELSDTDCAGYRCEDLRLVHSTCVAGRCEGSRLVEDCDDQVACSLDACDAISAGCLHDLLDERCDDSNPCTSDKCSATGCITEPVAQQALCGECMHCLAGSCVPSAVWDACQDEFGCSGVCDSEGGCVVEAFCQHSPSGCPDRPMVEYGQGVDCRFESDVIDLTVDTHQQDLLSSFVSVSISVQSRFVANLDELYLRFRFLPDGARYVIQSAFFKHSGSSPALWLLPEYNEAFLRLLPQDAVTQDESQTWQLQMLLDVKSGQPLSLRTDAWVPCQAQLSVPGCHFGYAADQEEIERNFDAEYNKIYFQLVSNLVYVGPQTQESSKTFEKQMLGCHHIDYGTEFGLIWIGLMVMLVRRRRAVV